MSKTRLVLWMLLVGGILVEVAAVYGSYHPNGLLGKPAIVLHTLFLIVVPLVVWKTQGERLLRTALMSTWVAYLVLWGIGFYRLFYRD